MKLAFVSCSNPADVNAWSGLPTHILQALRAAGADIETVCYPEKGFKTSSLSLVKRVCYMLFQRQRYLRDREERMVKSYAAEIEAQLKGGTQDVIFSLGTLPIAHLRTKDPIVFWADATFAGMVDFYPDFTNLCSETLSSGNAIEKSALEKASLAIYASHWAAQSAISHYHASPQKVKVVPFGANLDNPPCLDDLSTALQHRSLDKCKLLFVGVDWHRKGGPKALEVADLLNRRGFHTELHVVGCIPPRPSPAFVRNHGFISKDTERGRRDLDQLFLSSHFLILPSVAECYGLVFAEASAFGVPSLASDVGGVSTAINNGVNGWTLQVDASAAQYCDLIQVLMASPQSYRSAAMSCFKDFHHRLNWESAARKVVRLLDSF